MTNAVKGLQTDTGLATLLRALGDPLRLEIITILALEGEQTCAPLAVRVGVPQSTLSHHLRLLRESGATRSRKDGTLIWVSIGDSDLATRFPLILDAIVANTAPTG